MLVVECVRIACWLVLIGCVDERGHVDVFARIDVSARDRATVEAHCSDETPCGDATLEVTVDDLTTRIEGVHGDVALPAVARAITLTWSDGADTVSATATIPDPIAIVEPVAEAIVTRPGTLVFGWSVAHGRDVEGTILASCDDGIGRGITARFARTDPPASSASIDLAYFDALPPRDCSAMLALANLEEAKGIGERTTLFLRTQDVDRIHGTLAYRQKTQ